MKKTLLILVFLLSSPLALSQETIDTTLYSVGYFSHPDSIKEPLVSNFRVNLASLVKEEAQLILENKGYLTILGYPTAYGAKKLSLSVEELIHVKGEGICRDKYKNAKTFLGRIIEVSKMENCTHKIIVSKNGKTLFVTSVAEFQRLGDRLAIRESILNQLNEIPSKNDL